MGAVSLINLNKNKKQGKEGRAFSITTDSDGSGNNGFRLRDRVHVEQSNRTHSQSVRLRRPIRIKFVRSFGIDRSIGRRRPPTSLARSTDGIVVKPPLPPSVPPSHSAVLKFYCRTFTASAAEDNTSSHERTNERTKTSPSLLSGQNAVSSFYYVSHTFQ